MSHTVIYTVQQAVKLLVSDTFTVSDAQCHTVTTKLSHTVKLSETHTCLTVEHSNCDMVKHFNIQIGFQLLCPINTGTMFNISIVIESHIGTFTMSKITLSHRSTVSHAIRHNFNINILQSN